MLVGKGGGNLLRGDEVSILVKRRTGKTPAELCVEQCERIAQLESELKQVDTAVRNSRHEIPITVHEQIMQREIDELTAA